MQPRANGKRTGAILLGAAGLLLALFFFAPRPVPVDRQLHAEIGAALGSEARQLLRPGGKVTLITRDTQTFPQPSLDILRKSFERQFDKSTTVDILLVQVDPLRPASVPPGDFFELLRKSKPDDVIVSLLGPPVLSDQERFVLGGVRPKVVALCAGSLAGNLDLKRLAQAGLLHAAVVTRQFAQGTAETARAIPRNFASLYHVYHSSDLAMVNAD